MGNSLKRVKLGNSLGNSLTVTSARRAARLGNSLLGSGVVAGLVAFVHHIF